MPFSRRFRRRVFAVAHGLLLPSSDGAQSTVRYRHCRASPWTHIYTNQSGAGAISAATYGACITNGSCSPRRQRGTHPQDRCRHSRLIRASGVNGSQEALVEFLGPHHSRLVQRLGVIIRPHVLVQLEGDIGTVCRHCTAAAYIKTSCQNDFAALALGQGHVDLPHPSTSQRRRGRGTRADKRARNGAGTKCIC